MRNESLVFENMNGEAVRHLAWATDSLYVVYRKDSRSIEFVSQLEDLNLASSQYKVLNEIKKADFKKDSVAIGKIGHLRLLSNQDHKQLRPEVALIPEDQEALKPFVKKSSIAHISVLLFVFLTSFIIQKFFADDEPVIVQVIEQKRENFKEKTVAVSQKKVEQKKVIKAKASNKTKITKSITRNSHTKKVVTRPGQSVKNVGALGALGGMSKNFKGTGGLNLNSKSSNPGIAYGGSAQRGGYERGLVGRGLIKTGVGSGGSMQGYGGYGTSGKGGGQPGYGNASAAGSSGAYFEPLGEESLVEGGLDQDQINAVIQRHIGQVIYCYEQGLQTKPKLAGRVSVKFVIGSSGHVNTAGVANTSLSSKLVESCIVSKLRGWKFPRPVGGVQVRVTYPFVLKRLSQG